MTIKSAVEKLLEENKTLRDSDKKLIWSYWIVYDKAMPNDNKTLLLENFMDRCTTPESITRARREVQEKREDLRGSSWVEEKRRQKEFTKGQFINEEFSSNRPNYKEEVGRIYDELQFVGKEKYIHNGTVEDIPDIVL